MILPALCEGRGLSLCLSCARHVARYTAQQIAAKRDRITPTNTDHRCDAWRYASALPASQQEPPQ